MTPEEAIARGAFSGAFDAETVFEEQGREALRTKPGQEGWDAAAINAAAHSFDGVPDDRQDLRDLYYEAYAKAARARAKELVGEK